MKDKMKLFQVSYDTILITLLAVDKKDAIELVMESNNNCYPFEFIDGKLFVKWSENYTEEANIKAIKVTKRGIIQHEAH